MLPLLGSYQLHKGMASTTQIIEKYAADFRVYSCSWAALPEIIGGETIASQTVTCTPSGLIFGAEGINGSTTTCVISGGTPATQYQVVWTIVTSASHTITVECALACLAE